MENELAALSIAGDNDFDGHKKVLQFIQKNKLRRSDLVAKHGEKLVTRFSGRALMPLFLSTNIHDLSQIQVN
jgi:hypothetical protein